MSAENETTESAPQAYRRSASLVNLAPALAKAMGAMGAAIKDATNPHFRSRYATLAACHEAAIGPLSENGLSFPMFPLVDRKGYEVLVTALLLHASGEYLEGAIAIPYKDDHAQAIASAETYARRYLYCMVGIVPDDDDDGNSAVGDRKPQNQTPPRPAATAPKSAPKPKGEPKPAQAAKAPAKPATVPPPAPEPDPRQVTVEEIIDRQTTPSEPPAPERTVEPDDGPLTLDTREAIKSLIEQLGIPKVKAGEMVVEVTSQMLSDVMGRRNGRDGPFEGGSEVHARTFLHYLQDLALEAQGS